MMLSYYFRQPVDPAKWRKIGLIFIAIGSVVLLASIGITVRLTLRNKSFNECGYFPLNGFQWKIHIEMTFHIPR